MAEALPSAESDAGRIPPPQANLTAAARMMREEHGPEHERHAMWSAMADWLDSAAREHDEDDCFRFAPPNGCYEAHHAMNVALTYLGATRVTSPAE